MIWQRPSPLPCDHRAAQAFRAFGAPGIRWPLSRMTEAPASAKPRHAPFTPRAQCCIEGHLQSKGDIMHDIRAIRENPAAFDAALARRGLSPLSSDVLALDEARRAVILAAETAQAAQNAASKEVGAAKARGDDAEFERLRALVAEKKAEIARLNDEAAAERMVYFSAASSERFWRKA